MNTWTSHKNPFYKKISVHYRLGSGWASVIHRHIVTPQIDIPC